MLPTSTTGAATRVPSLSAVHTSIPDLTFVTRTSPFVDADRTVNELDSVVCTLGLDTNLERVGVTALREHERAQPLEGPIHRELLHLVEIAGRKILMGDDGRVELSIGPDLRVVGVGAGLLAAEARYGVKVRVAEHRNPDRVYDLELELVNRQGTAHDAPAARGRAAGDGQKRDRCRELAFHPLITQHASRCLNVTNCGTKSPGRAYSLRMVGGRSNL